MVVLYIDECHLVWGDACGYVWGPQDQRIVLPIANQRDKQTYYYNVTWSGTIEPTQPPLAVGAVGRVILVLDVLDECYGRFGVELAFG